MMFYFYRSYFILTLFVLAFSCDMPSNPEARNAQYFSILETDKAEPTKIKDELPKFSETEREQYKTIMDGFSKNASARFGDPELTKHIDRIEAIYIQNGRYLELIDLYEKEYSQKGTEAKMIERLAFAYIRLGQTTSARELLDQLGEDRPTSANLHFLEGSFWMRQPKTIPNFTNALKAWKKVLDYDPHYRGFEGMDANSIRQVIERLEQVVPKDALGEKDDSTDNPADDSTDNPAEEKDELVKDEVDPKDPLKESPKEVVTNEKEVAAEKDDKETKPEPTKPSSSSPKIEVKIDVNRSIEEQYLVQIAKADIAVSEGRFNEAESYYKAAGKIKPEGFEAIFGPLRAKWRFEPARNKIAVEIRKLSKTPLNARQAYQLGIFVYANLNAKKLSERLFLLVKTKDSRFAESVGIDDLLKAL